VIRNYQFLIFIKQNLNKLYRLSVMVFSLRVYTVIIFQNFKFENNKLSRRGRKDGCETRRTILICRYSHEYIYLRVQTVLLDMININIYIYYYYLRIICCSMRSLSRGGSCRSEHGKRIKNTFCDEIIVRYIHIIYNSICI